MDETVRGRTAITNMILAPQTRMIPGEWNSQRKASNTQRGWNIHMEASNTQRKLGPVEDAIEEKVIIPGVWNRQRKASNTQ